MEFFNYEPLNLERRAFRLLQLFKREGADIECIMYEAYLDGYDTIPYEALSYTWGGMETHSILTVNEKRLDVTGNLYAALQHLRLKERDRVLWVDAVCIDQGNKTERGHQVQHMCKIYSQAEEVIVWLGSATKKIDFLMESLLRLEQQYSICNYRDWDHAHWIDIWAFISHDRVPELQESLRQLLMRPWFRRVWILQEVANAKRAKILCGTKSIKAHTFALAPSFLGVEAERHCQAVLDIMPSRLREKSWWSERRDLSSLLVKFRESEASDPRDKIFALLGISSDAQDTNALRPDYAKDLQEIIRDTSFFLYGPLGVSKVTLSKENKKGGEGIVRRLLWPRIDEVVGPNSILEEAIDARDMDVLNLLVDEGIGSIAQKNLLDQALYTASSGGDEAIVKLLLEKGTDVNAQGGYYGNALQAASWMGREAVVKLLTARGARSF